MGDDERTAREDTTRDMLARELAVVADLVGRVDGPVGWLAVQRQARSYLRHLEPWLADSRTTQLGPELSAHRAALQGLLDHASAELRDLDDETVGQARARLGLRVALIGKGGAGKSVIASTMARLLARQGRRVFAADLDTNPGLAISLGLGTADFALPEALVEENAGSNYGWRLASGATPRQAVEEFATVGPDGVRFLGLGKIASVEKQAPKQTVVALTQILLGFGDAEWDVIADLEAGPTTPFERYHAFADDVVVVVGPSWQSAMTARRLLPMVGDRNTVIVANRFHAEPDHAALAPRVRIPFDPDLAAAERRGLSPVDACPNSPAVAGVRQLVEQLLAIPSVVST